MKKHCFVKEGSEWFIDLPEYLEQGGSKGDLQMVSGADTMLNLIAGEASEVTLQLDTEPFEGTNELVLTEECDPILGGVYYHLKNFEGAEYAQDIWLCEVTRFVFDGLPNRIWVKRI